MFMVRANPFKLILIAVSCSFFSCQYSNANTPENVVAEERMEIIEKLTDTVKKTVRNNVKEILAKKEIPILCYHHIRDYLPSDQASAKPYIVPVNVFEQQMKALKDSGYQSIVIEDLMNYLEFNQPLPEKAVMITFDDTNLNQYTNGLPLLDKYGFKGVFFMMTVPIGKERFMSKVQIKALADAGHDVQLHTWDHKNVKKFEEKDWDIQITRAAKTLENITGKPVVHFAFPFGLWSPDVLPKLEKLGMKSAYQLADKRDSQYPLYSIRRIIVPGTLSGKTLVGQMKKSF
jgi:peptidoglycan/xylan/chitin deacetylase (PgdA/CDA1 family)